MWLIAGRSSLLLPFVAIFTHNYLVEFNDKLGDELSDEFNCNLQTKNQKKKVFNHTDELVELNKSADEQRIK